MKVKLYVSQHLFFLRKKNMKQTREQAILLFSGIFNCDGKGLCRLL